MSKTYIQDRSIGYEGHVTVSLIDNLNKVKQVKTHNLGTVNLFKYIGLALMRDASALDHMPNYIHTYYWDQDNYSEDFMFDTSTCVMNIPAATKDIHLDEDQVRIEFEFLIPYTQIWGKSNILVLYGTTGFNYKDSSTGIQVADKEPLAYVNLGKDEINLEQENSNILINWTLTVRNQ